MELSTKWLSEDGEEKLSKDKKEEINKKLEHWAEDAMRVLCLAYKKTDGLEEVKADNLEELVWVGMTGIIDPPREDVKKAIEDCNNAGVRVMMVTGDHEKTAAAMAEEVGIIKSKKQKEDDEYPPSISSKDLDVDDEKFEEYLEHISVFARVDPQTKLRIAKSLQSSETLIAMTGDGVNDAPALKRADVGISMGIRGTDVAKDASEIVLQDDNFSSIVKAIEEGRIVFDNVKKTSYFLLTTNFAGTSVLIFGLLLGFPIPLTAAMILFVNLVTDGVMDVALATEPGHGNIMLEKPVKKSANILSWDVVPYLLLMAAIMVSLAMFAFNYYLPQGTDMARTGAFLVVALTQVFNVFNMRSLKESVFTIGPLTNKWINVAFIASIALQIAVIKIPFFRDLFGFENLPMIDFVVIFFASSLVLWGGELFKYIKYKAKLF